MRQPLMRLLASMWMTAIVMVMLGLGWMAYKAGIVGYFIAPVVLIGFWAYFDPQRLARKHTQE